MTTPVFKGTRVFEWTCERCGAENRSSSNLCRYCNFVRVMPALAFDRVGPPMAGRKLNRGTMVGVVPITCMKCGMEPPGNHDISEYAWILRTLTDTLLDEVEREDVPIWPGLKKVVDDLRPYVGKQVCPNCRPMGQGHYDIVRNIEKEPTKDDLKGKPRYQALLGELRDAVRSVQAKYPSLSEDDVLRIARARAKRIEEVKTHAEEVRDEYPRLGKDEIVKLAMVWSGIQKDETINYEKEDLRVQKLLREARPVKFSLMKKHIVGDDILSAAEEIEGKIGWLRRKYEMFRNRYKSALETERWAKEELDRDFDELELRKKEAPAWLEQAPDAIARQMVRIWLHHAQKQYSETVMKAEDAGVGESEAYRIQAQDVVRFLRKYRHLVYELRHIHEIRWSGLRDVTPKHPTNSFPNEAEKVYCSTPGCAKEATRWCSKTDSYLCESNRHQDSCCEKRMVRSVFDLTVEWKILGNGSPVPEPFGKGWTPDKERYFKRLIDRILADHDIDPAKNGWHWNMTGIEIGYHGRDGFMAGMRCQTGVMILPWEPKCGFEPWTHWFANLEREVGPSYPSAMKEDKDALGPTPETKPPWQPTDPADLKDPNWVPTFIEWKLERQGPPSKCPVGEGEAGEKECACCKTLSGATHCPGRPPFSKVPILSSRIKRLNDNDIILKDGRRIPWGPLRDLGDFVEVEIEGGAKIVIRKSEIIKPTICSECKLPIFKVYSLPIYRVSYDEKKDPGHAKPIKVPCNTLFLCESCYGKKSKEPIFVKADCKPPAAERPKPTASEQEKLFRKEVDEAFLEAKKTLAKNYNIVHFSPVIAFERPSFEHELWALVVTFDMKPLPKAFVYKEKYTILIHKTDSISWGTAFLWLWLWKSRTQWMSAAKSRGYTFDVEGLTKSCFRIHHPEKVADILGFKFPFGEVDPEDSKEEEKDIPTWKESEGERKASKKAGEWVKANCLDMSREYWRGLYELNRIRELNKGTMMKHLEPGDPHYPLVQEWKRAKEKAREQERLEAKEAKKASVIRMAELARVGVVGDPRPPDPKKVGYELTIGMIGFYKGIDPEEKSREEALMATEKRYVEERDKGVCAVVHFRCYLNWNMGWPSWSLISDETYQEWLKKWMDPGRKEYVLGIHANAERRSEESRKLLLLKYDKAKEKEAKEKEEKEEEEATGMVADNKDKEKKDNEKPDSSKFLEKSDELMTKVWDAIITTAARDFKEFLKTKGRVIGKDVYKKWFSIWKEEENKDLKKKGPAHPK